MVKYFCFLASNIRDLLMVCNLFSLLYFLESIVMKYLHKRQYFLSILRINWLIPMKVQPYFELISS